MRTFKTKSFNQWARRKKLTDQFLIKMINEITTRLYEAKLGAHLYKKRIAIGGKGKRGSLRTIIAFKQDDKAFFIYGYAKNEQDNISETERLALLKLAKDYFQMDQPAIMKMINAKKLWEI